MRNYNEDVNYQHITTNQVSIVNKAITGSTNLGSGNGTIYTSTSNKNLQLKTISGGSNVVITTNANYIGINTIDVDYKVQTLTTGSTISWNMASGNTGVLTLVVTGTTISNPTNISAGNTYKLIIKQNAAGNKTITTWGNYFKFPGAVKPVLTGTANSIDIFEFFAETNTVLYLNNFIKRSVKPTNL